MKPTFLETNEGDHTVATGAGGDWRVWLLGFSIALVVGGGVVILAARMQTLDSVEVADLVAGLSAQEDHLHWPTDPETGKVRQLGKYSKDLKENPGLLYIKDLPGAEALALDITAIGVEMINADEAERLGFDEGWVLLDVRKDRDLIEKGGIPGAVHYEYKYEGAKYSGSTRLDTSAAIGLLETAPGVVVYCNGPTCPRSFNACVALVQEWGLESGRVKWFRGGVPAWRGTLLLSLKPDRHDEEGMR